MVAQAWDPGWGKSTKELLGMMEVFSLSIVMFRDHQYLLEFIKVLSEVISDWVYFTG